MAKDNESMKLLTIVLAAVIILATVVIIYVNLPGKETDDDQTDDTEDGTEELEEEDEEESEPIFSLIYGDTELEYTLEEIENMDLYTGSGAMIKTGWFPEIVISGPNDYTGIEITYLLNQIENKPENYTINVISSDDRETEYNQSYIQGNVDIYNDTGDIIATSGVTMILAFKENGEYLNKTDAGNLRIAFVDDEKITSSSLWAKYVTSIEIIEIID